MAAMRAGARPHVDQVVGGADRFLVMLDHQHRVAEIAQAGERLQQPVVVALVQADRRLVQHVEHAGQARADLRGEPDALALAARQGARGAVQRQVGEADIVEEAQPLVDLLEDAGGDLALLGRQLGRQLAEPLHGLADAELGRLADVEAGDLHRQRLGLQAGAVAGLALALALEALQLLAHPGGIGLLPAAVEIGDHALERLGGLVLADAVVVAHGDRFAAAAVEDHVAHLLGQVAPRHRHLDLEVLGDALQRLHVILARRIGPRRDRPFGERQPVVRHHHLRIEEHLYAQPVAGRAGALRRVEGEQPGLDLLDAEARDGAGEARREDGALAAVGVLRHRESFGEIERRLDRIGQAVAEIGPHDDAIHHHVDVVLVFLVERRRLGDLVELAVDLDPLETLLLQLLQFLAVLALAAARDGRHQVEPRALGHRLDAIDHLRDGLAFDRQAGGRRVGHAHAGEQQTQIVVDFRDRADRRARIARRRLLLDRDGGREALDRIDVGLLHQFEELAGIGRQALDVAALALGIDRVEGERGLARARQAGDHHQPVARQVEVDVLQIVFAGATDGDETMRLGDGGAGFCHWTGRIGDARDHRIWRLTPSPARPGVRLSLPAVPASGRSAGRSSAAASCRRPGRRTPRSSRRGRRSPSDQRDSRRPRRPRKDPA